MIAQFLSQILHLHFEWNLVLCFHNFRKGDKLVHKFLAHDFLDDVLVIIVSQSTTQFIIVHVVLVFTEAPQASDFFCIYKFKFSIIVGPLYDVLVLVAQQQLQ